MKSTRSACPTGSYESPSSSRSLDGLRKLVLAMTAILLIERTNAMYGYHSRLHSRKRESSNGFCTCGYKEKVIDAVQQAPQSNCSYCNGTGKLISLIYKVLTLNMVKSPPCTICQGTGKDPNSPSYPRELATLIAEFSGDVGPDMSQAVHGNFHFPHTKWAKCCHASDRCCCLLCLGMVTPGCQLNNEETNVPLGCFCRCEERHCCYGVPCLYLDCKARGCCINPECEWHNSSTVCAMIHCGCCCCQLHKQWDTCPECNKPKLWSAE